MKRIFYLRPPERDSNGINNTRNLSKGQPKEGEAVKVLWIAIGTSTHSLEVAASECERRCERLGLWPFWKPTPEIGLRGVGAPPRHRNPSPKSLNQFEEGGPAYGMLTRETLPTLASIRRAHRELIQLLVNFPSDRGI